MRILNLFSPTPIYPLKITQDQRSVAIRFRCMLASPFILLVALALIFAVCSIIWSGYPLLPVAVILLSVALLIGHALPPR